MHLQPYFLPATGGAFGGASCYNDMVLLVMLHFLQFLYVCRSLLPISLFIFFFSFLKISQPALKLVSKALD